MRATLKQNFAPKASLSMDCANSYIADTSQAFSHATVVSSNQTKCSLALYEMAGMADRNEYLVAENNLADRTSNCQIISLILATAQIDGCGWSFG